MKYFRKIWPLLVIFLIWFIFSSPYFIKGLVPFPSSYQVNFFHPWSLYEKYWGPVKNNAMPDIIDQIYPWRHFTIETWKNGQIPFWNPNSFSGNPHLANYQSATFSPFNILFFLFSFIDAWSIMVLLQPLLGGFFMFLLMKEFKVGNLGSILSSVAFMFCGFVVVWMAYGTLSFAIVFLPLSIFAIEKSYKKLDKKSLILLVCSVPFSFFAGHFQTSIYYFIAIVLFLAFKFIQTRDIWKSLIVGIAILSGIIISFPQLIPSIQFYLYSARSEIFIKGGGIPPYYLVNIFSPDFFGNPVTRNDWFGYYAEWASFVGIIPFVFAFLGFSRKNKLSLFFLFLGILSLVLAIDSPVQKIIGVLKIPVLSTSTPSRIIVLFSFSLAVLAGLGLDRLKELVKKNDKKPIYLFLTLISGLIVLIWVLILFVKVLPSDKILIAKRNFILPSIFFVILYLLILLNLKVKKKYFLEFSIAIFVIMACFDSLRFAQKWIPFDREDLVFIESPIIRVMKENIGYGRVFGNLGGHVDTYYNLPSIEGYDPLYIERYGEFIRSSDTGKFTEGERSVVKIGRKGKNIDRVLDLLGVNLIFHPIADTNQNWAYPVWKDNKRFSLIYQDDKFQLFRNNLALPRAALFYDFEVIEDKKEAIERFYTEDFNFRNKLILEEKINGLKQGNGSAQIIEYTPNKVKIKVITSSPALLFLSDNYYPGWQAEINGVKTKIYRADYSFRAVIVSRGSSVVDFTYGWFF